jgi:hypothetical protein
MHCDDGAICHFTHTLSSAPVDLSSAEGGGTAPCKPIDLISGEESAHLEWMHTRNPLRRYRQVRPVQVPLFILAMNLREAQTSAHPLDDVILAVQQAHPQPAEAGDVGT